MMDGIPKAFKFKKNHEPNHEQRMLGRSTWSGALDQQLAKPNARGATLMASPK